MRDVLETEMEAGKTHNKKKGSEMEQKAGSMLQANAKQNTNDLVGFAGMTGQRITQFH